MKRTLVVYTKDSEKYIYKVIKSILEQMTNEDELIIVDDMSTDNTIPIIVGLVGYMWADEEHYKLFINTSVKGKKESISRAKQIAKGDFIFIINKHKRIKI